MGYKSIMLKPASSLCNMRCSYCFYADVSKNRAIQDYGLMSERTAARIIEKTVACLEDGDRLCFAFQGGEPTLAGISFYKSFVAGVDSALKSSGKAVQIEYAIQTNGLLLNDEWCEFFAANGFLVGLSLDGTADLHDANRTDVCGRATWNRVISAKTLLEQHHAEYNVLFVLTAAAARRPQKIWNFLKSREIRYVQFVPCIGNLEAETPQALTPKRFASFYIALFKLWKADYLKGDCPSIQFFEDVCNLLCRGHVTSCGMTGQCQNQTIIEADGSVYPCDFYVLDQWRLGNMKSSSYESMDGSPVLQSFLDRRAKPQPLCESCAYWKICGGGCPRMEKAMYVSDDGAFCGYQAFLTECGFELQQIGQCSIPK